MTAESTISLLFPDSLNDTLDAVNAALFENIPLPESAKVEVVGWLVSRQGLPGSYAGMFAPAGADYAVGALTFTAEPVESRAGVGHMLGEEACYVLNRLGVDTLEASEALKHARRGIFYRMNQSEREGILSGTYCCGTCTVALWRHLLASGAADDQRRLSHGLDFLCRHRDEKGRWRHFPYYYTLLALSEMDLALVREEIQYAARGMEHTLRRLIKQEGSQELGKFDWRRQVLLQRVLERC
jgi:hypothetical protein